MANQTEEINPAEEEQEISQQSSKTEPNQTDTPSTSKPEEPPKKDGNGAPHSENIPNPWGYFWAGGSDFISVNGVRPERAPFMPAPFPAFFHPTALPGFAQLPEQQAQQGGLFAVPFVPVMGPIIVLPSGGLTPISLNASYSGTEANAQQVGTDTVRPSDAERPTTDETRDAPAGEAAPGANGLRHRHGAPQRAAQVHRAEGHRRIVRRFHVGFRLDLLLILKLAVVVFVFNQDGSRDRLLLLLFLAGLVYLYQTGALTPLLQWISQSAQRAMMPPQPLAQPGNGQQGVPDRQVPAGGGNAPNERGAAAAAPAEPARDPVGRAAAGEILAEHAVEQPPQRANRWGIFKEIQMLVVGFVTSLLPGYQHAD